MSIMLLSRLTLWSVLSCLATAQQWRDYNSLCDKTIDGANASGVWTYQPDVSGLTRRLADVSWAYTVYHNDTTLQTVWWYNTGGANYSDDFSNGYDVCAFRLRNVTSMARWNAFNKDDNGNCEKTLDADCVKDLKKLAYKTAQDQVGESSPTANLTEGALPTVCNNIANVIQNQLPEKCQKYFDPNFEVASWQMSDYNRTSADVGCCSELQSNSCPIYANQSQATMTQQEILGSTDIAPTNVTMENSDWYPSSWHAWWGLDLKIGFENSTAVAEYDYFTQGVFPMLTVYMSLANNRRRVYIEGNAQLTCVRASNFAQGARHEPPLHPQDTFSSGLSKGVIGGIAGGSVVGVTIILVAAFLFYRRRKALAAGPEREKSVSSGPTDLGADTVDEKRRDAEIAELDEANEVFEKEGNIVGMEMHADAKKVFEMQGSDGSDTMRTYEMQGDTIQSELESPGGTTLVGSGAGTFLRGDFKEVLEPDEKKQEVEIAELMGSEPEPVTKQQEEVRQSWTPSVKQQEEVRQSWTPSVRLVEDIEGEQTKKDDKEDGKGEENPPKF